MQGNPVKTEDASISVADLNAAIQELALSQDISVLQHLEMAANKNGLPNQDIANYNKEAAFAWLREIIMSYSKVSEQNRTILLREKVVRYLGVATNRLHMEIKESSRKKEECSYQIFADYMGLAMRYIAMNTELGNTKLLVTAYNDLEQVDLWLGQMLSVFDANKLYAELMQSAVSLNLPQDCMYRFSKLAHKHMGELYAATSTYDGNFMEVFAKYKALTNDLLQQSHEYNDNDCKAEFGIISRDLAIREQQIILLARQCAELYQYQRKPVESLTPTPGDRSNLKRRFTNG